MNEAELDQLVADRVAAMRDTAPIRADFTIRIMRAIEAAPVDGGTAPPARQNDRSTVGADMRTPIRIRQRLVARELVLAFAVVVFVALLAGGAAWVRSQSHAAHHRTPSPTVTAASLIGVWDIHMVTAQVGWAFTVRDCSPCYPTSILRTTDGGRHWTDTTGPISEPVDMGGGSYVGSPPAVFFLDSVHAWYAGQVSLHDLRVVVHSTADGGVTWRESKILSLGAGHVVSLQFIDLQSGWMTIGVGGDIFPRSQWSQWNGAAIYQTLDGGTTWKQIELTPYLTITGQATVGGLPPTCIKNGPVFNGPIYGWVSGSCPGGLSANQAPDTSPLPLYLTNDGGRTWLRQVIPVPAGYPSKWFDHCICDVASLQFPDAEDGVFVVGTEYGIFDILPITLSLKPTLFITHDGGTSWEAKALPAGYHPQVVHFINGSVGWVAGGAQQDLQIYRTDDGGTSWTQVYDAAGQNVSVIDFVDQLHGWAAIGGEVLRTSDGGRTWSR